MRIDDGCHRIGGVVKAIHEFEAESDEQGHDKKQKQQEAPGGVPDCDMSE